MFSEANVLDDIPSGLCGQVSLTVLCGYVSCWGIMTVGSLKDGGGWSSMTESSGSSSPLGLGGGG